MIESTLFKTLEFAKEQYGHNLSALRTTGRTKKELLWVVHTLFENKVKPINEPELFNVETKHYQ